MKRLEKLSNLEVILVLVTITGVTTFISAAVSPGGVTDNWWANWFQNLSAGMAGTIITFLLLVLVVERRDKLNDAQERFEIEQREHLFLLKQAGDNLQARQDVLNRMMARGLLVGIDLNGCNLEGVNLKDANLKSAKLRRAKLKGANLIGANLENAFATDADFEDAIIVGANLEYASFRSTRFNNANLTASNLRGAFLVGADFSSANLTKANICNVVLSNPDIAHSAIFNEKTILPNGDTYSASVYWPQFTDQDCME